MSCWFLVQLFSNIGCSGDVFRFSVEMKFEEVTLTINEMAWWLKRKKMKERREREKSRERKNGVWEMRKRTEGRGIRRRRRRKQKPKHFTEKLSPAHVSWSHQKYMMAKWTLAWCVFVICKTIWWLPVPLVRWNGDWKSIRIPVAESHKHHST